MRKYFHIQNDVCFISDRIKEIDKNYFILFNLLKNKYEVHYLGQRGGTYCFTIPYDSLDDRTLFYTRKTKIENRAEIIAEIDKQNEKIEKDSKKIIRNKLEEVLL